MDRFHFTQMNCNKMGGFRPKMNTSRVSKMWLPLEILKKEEPGNQSGVAIKGESPDKEGGH